jgi:hypothetical protein
MTDFLEDRDFLYSLRGFSVFLVFAGAFVIFSFSLPVLFAAFQMNNLVSPRSSPFACSRWIAIRVPESLRKIGVVTSRSWIVIK